MMIVVSIENANTGQTQDLVVDIRSGRSLVTALASAGLQPDYEYNILNVALHTEDDPLIEPDPRFPDRPHTLDFARLSAAVTSIDSESDSGRAVPDIIGVDDDSLLYLITERVRKARNTLRMIEKMTGAPLVEATVNATHWMDGFVAGQRFERRGGHRED